MKQQLKIGDSICLAGNAVDEYVVTDVFSQFGAIDGYRIKHAMVNETRDITVSQYNRMSFFFDEKDAVDCCIKTLKAQLEMMVVYRKGLK